LIEPLHHRSEDLHSPPESFVSAHKSFIEPHHHTKTLVKPQQFVQQPVSVQYFDHHPDHHPGHHPHHQLASGKTSFKRPVQPLSKTRLEQFTDQQHFEQTKH